MEAVIRKWGNSPALRLPTLVLKEAALSLEQKVRIVVTRGRIVIEPSEHVEYNLDDLLAGITSQNAHAEVSFGPDGHPKLLHSWPVKLLQAGRVDYAESGTMARRAAASLSL